MGKRDKPGKVPQTEPAIVKFSQSKIKTWRRCQAAYHYRYNEEITTKRPAKPLIFGKIVHEILEFGEDRMMEILENYAEKYDDLFIEEQEKFGNIIDDIHDICTEYFRHYKDSDYKPYKIDGRDREFEIDVMVAPGVVFNGKVDRLVKHKGKTYILEQKTFKRMPDESHRWRDMQTALYAKALRLMGHEIDGVIWDYICSKPPTVPQVLKNGELSTRPINTLPTTLRRFSKHTGIAIPEAMMDAAKANRSSYFFRFTYPVKKSIADLLMKEFIESAQQIKDIGSDSRIMNISRECTFCEYEPICRAVLGGLDVDFIKEKQFQRREPAHKTIEADDDAD